LNTGIFILTKIWLRLYYQADQILHLSEGNEQKSVIVESEESTKADEKEEPYHQHLDDAIAAYRKISEFAIGRDLTEKEQAKLDKECETIIERESIEVDPIHEVKEIYLEGKGKIETGPPTLTRFEKARIMGARALQLSLGAPPFIQIPKTARTSLDIAMGELEKRVIPITIRRVLPNGDYQNIPIEYFD